jgi:glycerol uptake facilitator-like aquaporin
MLTVASSPRELTPEATSAGHRTANDAMVAWRSLLAEALGTACLLAVVIGSGIMGERLSAGNAAIALAANTLATVAGLYVLIEICAPISGAHFNPIVSAVMALRGALSKKRFVGYVLAQLVGAICGALLAHGMFDMDLFQVSTKMRTSTGLWLGEIVATSGLMIIVLRAPPSRVAAMVAAFIGAGYWFTSSTSFANPAAVIGRVLTDSFAGIAPSSAPGFVAAEVAGAALALLLNKALGTPTASPVAPLSPVPIPAITDNHV